MIPDAVIAVQERTDVAAARRAAVELAAFGEDTSGVLGLIVTEAATNLLKHAGGGFIAIRRIDSAPNSGVEVVSMGKGPGISNPAKCFEDGYSTAGSSGTGLGAVSRLSTFLDYYTSQETGTVLMARVGTQGAQRENSLEIGSIGSAYPGESISGDSWTISDRGAMFRLVLADGLGHGIFAGEASMAAIETARASSGLDTKGAMERCHLALKSTRGAAVSLADVDLLAGTLDYNGIGNVFGSIVPEIGRRHQLVNSHGTVGHQIGRNHPSSFALSGESLVILHTDGLSASWDFEKYPGLFQRHPTVIAAVLFRDFRRGKDDATVVVARCKKMVQ